MSGNDSTGGGQSTKSRRIVFRITSILIALALATVIAEIALQTFTVSLLGEDRTAAFFDRYNTRPDGMYFRDRELGMNFMWPSAEMTAYSHGYFWTHRTDERGFRNPEDRRKTDILLLGDSMIYGHGLDDDETVASFLRREYGHHVYNMARQGDCLHEQYVLTRLFLDELSPQTILLFVFSNDLVDLTKTRNADQIDRAPEIEAYDYRAIRKRIARESEERPDDSFLRRFIIPKLLFSLKKSKRTNEKFKNRAAERKKKIMALQEEGVLPQFGETLDLEHARRVLSVPKLRRRITGNWRTLDGPSLSRVEHYYRRILLDLKHRCDARKAKLVVVNLALIQEDYWRANNARWGSQIEERLEFEITREARDYVLKSMFDLRARSAAQVGAVAAKVTRDIQIEHLDLSQDFRSIDNYLPNDGHLSRKGHEKLAERLHRMLSSS